eukprot:7637649-Alexandrium_andersonii.AAC.1
MAGTLRGRPMLGIHSVRSASTACARPLLALDPRAKVAQTLSSGNWQDLRTQSAGPKSALQSAVISQFRALCFGNWDFQKLCSGYRYFQNAGQLRTNTSCFGGASHADGALERGENAG